MAAQTGAAARRLKAVHALIHAVQRAREDPVVSQRWIHAENNRLVDIYLDVRKRWLTDRSYGLMEYSRDLRESVDRIRQHAEHYVPLLGSVPE